MNDTEFDRMLRNALLDAVKQDWDFILEGDSPPPPAFSARYCRTRAKLLSDPFGYVKRKKRPLWKKVLQAAACFVLIAGITFGGLMAFNPEARAWFVRVIAEWKDTYTRYTFIKEATKTTDVGVWRPQYVPEGFVETDSLALESVGYVVYTKPNETFINFSYMLIESTGHFSNDNQYNDYYQVTVGDTPADLYVSNTEGKPSYLIWLDAEQGIEYQLTSTIDVQELISIAESIQKMD